MSCGLDGSGRKYYGRSQSYIYINAAKAYLFTCVKKAELQCTQCTYILKRGVTRSHTVKQIERESGMIERGGRVINTNSLTLSR